MFQRHLTSTLITTLLICLLAGGIGAFFLGRDRADARTAVTPPVRRTVTSVVVVTASPGSSAPAGVPSISGRSTPSESQSLTSPSPSPSPNQSSPSSIGASPTTASAGPSEIVSEPAMTNDTKVRLAASAADSPQAAQIRDLVQRHFDAINIGDYQLWSGTMTSEEVLLIPRDRWLLEYSTSKDSNIVIESVQADPFAANLSFRSRQSPEFAPDKKSRCVDWKVTMSLESSGSAVLIGRSSVHQPGYSPCSS